MNDSSQTTSSVWSVHIIIPLYTANTKPICNSRKPGKHLNKNRICSKLHYVVKVKDQKIQLCIALGNDSGHVMPK